MDGLARINGPSQRRRSCAKLDGHSHHNGRSGTIMDEFSSQNERSWVKVDGHTTKSERSKGIKVLKWMTQIVQADGP